MPRPPRELGKPNTRRQAGHLIVTPWETPPGALTLVFRVTPVIGRRTELAVTQNRLPSEFGKTPAMAEFRVTMRAWATTPPRTKPPAMKPAANIAMGEACMEDSVQGGDKAGHRIVGIVLTRAV